jgi:hypothetical protein
MYTTPADAPGIYSLDAASTYCSALYAHGHQDWRVPSKGELTVLFNNRTAIGEFDVSGSDPAGWYWSASQLGEWNAWGQRFSDAGQDFTNKDNPSSVRCVRVKDRPEMNHLVI